MFVIDRLALHNLGKYGETSVTSCKFDHKGDGNLTNKVSSHAYC
jgi:hypothetical protein